MGVLRRVRLPRGQQSTYSLHERLVFGHVTRALHSEPPFAPKVALVACFGVGRDDRNEQPAVVDLLPDPAVPGVAASQFALIESDLNGGCAQCIANLLGRLGILRGIAQKHNL